MRIEKIISKFKCLLFGHMPIKIRWNNKYDISLNRKGGKKRAGKSIITKKTNHYQIICRRCGKIIKKK